MSTGSKSAAQVLRLAARDGGLRCFYCGHELLPPLERYSKARWYPTIDHVIPKSRGGTRADFNCVLACSPCNHRKGSRLDLFFLRVEHLEAENRRLRAALERAEAMIVRTKLWHGVNEHSTLYRPRNGPNPCRRCRGVHLPGVRDACWPPGRGIEDDELLGKRASRSLHSENTGPRRARQRHIRQRAQAARDRALTAAGLIAPRPKSGAVG